MCSSKKTMKKPEISVEVKTIALNIQPTFRVRWIMFAKEFFADCEDLSEVERCFKMKDEERSKMALADLFMALEMSHFMLATTIGRYYGQAENVQDFYSNVKLLAVIQGVLNGDESSPKKTVISHLCRAITELCVVRGPKLFFELKLRNHLGFFLALFDKKAMAKENLKKTKGIYDKIVNQPSKEKQNFLRWIQWNEPEFEAALNAEHFSMIENYFLYYQMSGDRQKEIQNGLLALKYLVHHKINQDSRFLFAAYAIDISSSCIKEKALAQSHYVLRAASHVMDKFSSTKDSLFSKDVMSDVKADLKLAYIQHMINLIVVSYQQAVTVTNVDMNVVKIEGLQVPHGNEMHGRLLKNKSEAVKVYTKAKNTLKVVQKCTHYDEWAALSTHNALEKIKPLVQGFPN